ncbi:uncharacterized protein YndB with AHSA1/START domain [Microbacterium sp. AK009]|uniref:SRPBCC family protein n=1 Tax=Microbacterium sp. AK009 TaxID=2723068 RepID=UPI0015CEB0D2|nr:SRPBCC domain-containing protein [Microbacterium sp. AK009]NYF16539.1 uncharacterized protein YndB with AHSA1/START domain [Microbacterium sp. AK009]
MKITQRRTYRHTPDVVWRALTDRDAIRQWWLDTNFEPVPGKEVWFQDNPQGSWDGRSVGIVLDADPPRRVRFGWSGGGQDMIVTYTLTPTPEGGTTVTITQDGLRGVNGLFLSVLLRLGWRSYLRQQLPHIAHHLAEHPTMDGYPVPPKAERAKQ